eukprot:GHVU01122262.1.p1 GENE.GHVU01122262.1~~GHVU01122262.1.p1  ORF type:complete len:130 (+),score=6.83 GHVU01122262.1:284-673(+)
MQANQEIFAPSCAGDDQEAVGNEALAPPKWLAHCRCSMMARGGGDVTAEKTLDVYQLASCFSNLFTAVRCASCLRHIPPHTSSSICGESCCKRQVYASMPMGCKRRVNRRGLNGTIFINNCRYIIIYYC